VLFRSSEKPIEVKLKRAAGPFPSVTHRLEDGDVGYIRLAGFEDATADQLAAAVTDLRGAGGNKVIGFVVDLRNNPGGNFDAAVKAADAFLDKGDITVVKSRKPDTAKHIAATPGDIANGQPIVALINGGTAREAELVAAALQDNKRAQLVGEPTYGDASQRKAIAMDDGGAIILSVAKYYSPNGQAIQDTRVTPALLVAEPQPQVDYDENGEPVPQSQPQVDQQRKSANDPVVKKALEVLNK
jgi:carboxyl-terminal processing protease